MREHASGPVPAAAAARGFDLVLDHLQLDRRQIEDLPPPAGDHFTVCERLATGPALRRAMDQDLIGLRHRF